MFLKRRLSHAQGYLELGMVAEAAAELAHIQGADAESTEVLAVRLAVLHEQRDWRAVRDLARELVRRAPVDERTRAARRQRSCGLRQPAAGQRV